MARKNTTLLCFCSAVRIRADLSLVGHERVPGCTGLSGLPPLFEQGMADERITFHDIMSCCSDNSVVKKTILPRRHGGHRGRPYPGPDRIWGDGHIRSLASLRARASLRDTSAYHTHAERRRVSGTESPLFRTQYPCSAGYP